VTLAECSREQEVVAAVVGGRWPMGCAEALREHVRGCAVCQDVANVATAFAADHDTGWAAAHVPSAAHVWWRTQIRARQEAARAVSRPLNIVQWFAVAAAIGLAIALVQIGVSAGVWSVSTLTTSIAAWPRATVAGVVSLALASREATVVFGTVVACLLLMPIAVYFALSENESDARSPEP
jgi:hypothetical protein